MVKRGLQTLLVTAALCLFGPQGAKADKPPFEGSIFIEPDIIKKSDTSMYLGLNFQRVVSKNFYDDRAREALPAEFFRFAATYKNSKPVTFDINMEVWDVTIATGIADGYGRILGQLPLVLRTNVKHVVVHETGEGWFANADGLVIIQNGDFALNKRQGVLEELFFHESVHTSLDRKIERMRGWQQAQKSDPAFITDYAEWSPIYEDVAETFLIHYALVMRPERVSRRTLRKINKSIPNRLRFLGTLYPASKLGL